MSDANKAVLLAANAAVSAGDNDGFLSHCTDDVRWDFVGDQVLIGKAAVRAYMTATYVEPPQFDVERLIADGDFVIAMGRIGLKDKAGRLVGYEYCDLWRLRGGKLAELKAYVVEVKNPPA